MLARWRPDAETAIGTEVGVLEDCILTQVEVEYQQGVPVPDEVPTFIHVNGAVPVKIWGLRSHIFTVKEQRYVSDLVCKCQGRRFGCLGSR